MDARTLADTLADPIGVIGMSYYFSPQAIAIGETIELDVVTFYGAGRGGVLGDVEPTEVDEVFYFFNPGMIAGLIKKSQGGPARSVIVAKHLEAAAAFAHVTFGGIDAGVLRSFSDAATALFDTLPSGQWPLVDGYLALGTPEDVISRAYYSAVVIRELRGGVHTDAVKAAGMSAVEACQLDREGAYFTLHGYGDDQRVEETDALKARRLEVEENTSASMASLLEALPDAERTALAEGATAMFDALSAPVPAGG